MIPANNKTDPMNSKSLKDSPRNNKLPTIARGALKAIPPDIIP